MRKVSLVIALILGSSVILPTYVSAASPSAGSACAKAGLTNSTATKKFTCIKSGKKLVWDKGVAIVKPASAPVTATTSTASTASTASTTPGEGDPGSTLLKDGLCVAISAGTQVTAHLQLFINGSWKTSSAPVTWQNVGSCDSGHKERNSVPNASVMINDGTKYRWQVTPGAGGTGPDGLSPETTYKAPAGQTQGSTNTQSSTPAAPAPAKPPFKATMPITLPVPQNGPITFANVLDHVSEIQKTAWQRVQDVIAANSPTFKGATNNVVHTGPNTQIDVIGGMSRIQQVLNRAEILWSGFTQVKNFELLMYNAQDEPWAEQDWTATATANKYLAGDITAEVRRIAGNCQTTISPGVFSGTPSNCRGADSSAISNSDDSILTFGQGGQGAANDTMITSGGVVGHEYNHSVQAAQWIGNPKTYCTEQTNSPNCFRSADANSFAPCWLIEGQGNSVGWASASETYDIYTSMTKNRPYNQGPTTITDYTQSSLRDYLFNQKPNDCISDGNIYRLGYSVGGQAVEILTAIAGPQSTMALYALGAEGQDFSTAFKNVYGISWDEASTILSKVLAAEYATFGPAPK